MLRILLLVLSILIPILLVACSSGVPAVDEPTPSAGSSAAKIQPTIPPTVEPTATPTATPTVEPTATPTVEPTIEPTATPIPLPPPVIFTPFEAPFADENGISKNIIGIPELSIAYANVSGKILDAVEFRICPKNRFGDALKKYGYGNNCFVGSTDRVVIPFVDATTSRKINGEVLGSEKGEVSDYLPFTSDTYLDLVWNTDSSPASSAGWTLHGYETATQAEIALARVHFQDGTVWKAN